MPSGGGGSQTKETKPWEAQQPYLKKLFNRSESLIEGEAEDAVAGFTEDQEAGRAAARNVAQSALGKQGGVTQEAVSELEKAISGTSGPHLEEMIDMASRPVRRQFEEETLPQIRRNALATGNLGGSRQGVAEGIAARGLSEALADQAIQVQNQQVARQLQAAGMAPGLEQSAYNLQLQPADTLRAIGSEEQTLEQMLKDAEFERLRRFQQLVGGGGYGSQVTVPGPTANPFGSALGGAATGAAIGSAVPVIGTGIGAAVGGLGGYLSARG